MAGFVIPEYIAQSVNMIVFAEKFLVRDKFKGGVGLDYCLGIRAVQIIPGLFNNVAVMFNIIAKGLGRFKVEGTVLTRW